MLTYSVSITRLKKNLMEGGSGFIDNFNVKLWPPSGQSTNYMPRSPQNS